MALLPPTGFPVPLGTLPEVAAASLRGPLLGPSAPKLPAQLLLSDLLPMLNFHID